MNTVTTGGMQSGRALNLYHSALHIVILRIGDDVRERLLTVLHHPTQAIVKAAIPVFA
ncbi:hypothetical protein [Pectobacterium sp. A5351]|uniref:hypothetical protein n=1 Tax=Pectobacterium sp. A5351 TaxID=2914983 RepID=UPI00232E393D|nr:hypothetical protein [Pectobacterium sp. A5351]WCG83524.1 hypothetical protein O1Q74_02095 [Pectobacterium sp. A5351]